MAHYTDWTSDRTYTAGDTLDHAGNIYFCRITHTPTGIDAAFTDYLSNWSNLSGVARLSSGDGINLTALNDEDGTAYSLDIYPGYGITIEKDDSVDPQKRALRIRVQEPLGVTDDGLFLKDSGVARNKLVDAELIDRLAGMPEIPANESTAKRYEIMVPADTGDAEFAETVPPDSNLTQDHILDLAKQSRTAGDRGKPLGVSPTDHDDLVLLDMGAVTRVRAGHGLAGSAEIGDLTLDINAGDGIEIAEDKVRVDLDGDTLTRGAAGLKLSDHIVPTLIPVIGSTSVILIWGWHADLAAAQAAADSITAGWNGRAFDAALGNSWVHSRDDLPSQPANTSLFSAYATAFYTATGWEIDTWTPNLSDSAFTMQYTDDLFPSALSSVTASAGTDTKFFRHRQPDGSLGPWIRYSSAPSIAWNEICSNTEEWPSGNTQVNFPAVLDLNRYRELLFTWRWLSGTNVQEGYAEARITTDKIETVSYQYRREFDSGASLGLIFSNSDGGSICVNRAPLSLTAGQEATVQKFGNVNLARADGVNDSHLAGLIYFHQVYSRNKNAEFRLMAR